MVVICFFIYLVCVIGVLSVCNAKRYHGKQISPIDVKIKKNGLFFNCKQRCKINIGNAKVLQLNNIVYLKRNNHLVIIKNVDIVATKNGMLYFNPQGLVQIVLNCKLFYKYFNIIIKSANFDIKTLKNQAILDILNNLFNLNNCIKTKRYVYVLKEILNIQIGCNSLLVTPNKYNICFSLTYKLDNKIKTVIVN